MLLRKKSSLLICAFISALIFPFPSSAVQDITHLPKRNDPFSQYEIRLIQLALEKTRTSYGDYTLRSFTNHPDTKRTRDLENLVRSDQNYPNYVRSFGYSSLLKRSDIKIIPFPVNLGIYGYRVCFVSDKLKAKVEQSKTIDDLKKFVFGLVFGWSDVNVLKHNGFKVHVSHKFTSLFHMTAQGRTHLFCRSINEIKHEYENNKHIKDLNIDESFAFYYPHPRVFVTHKNNSLVAERIEKGLLDAYKDGSLFQLWIEFNHESIEFSGLKGRKIYYLENPIVKNIGFDFEKYRYRSE